MPAMKPRFKPVSRRSRRLLAVPAILAVLLAAVITTTNDHGGSVISALPGATADPTGPTGGPGGDGGFNGGQFQPPGMPSPPGGYNGGSYPEQGQSDYGVDINSPAAQAPEYSQAPGFTQQQGIGQQQPANGTQPPDYERPIQQPSASAQPTSEQAPRESSSRDTGNNPVQTTAISSASESISPSRGPESSPTSSPQSATSTASNQDRQNQNCDQSTNSTSAMTDGQVRYVTDSTFRDQIADAASDWNALGSKASIQPSSDSSAQPSLVIGDVNDPGLGWRAKYVVGRDGQPAHIFLNHAFMDHESPAEVQGVIAHELGHAIGLPDTSGAGEIMAGDKGGALTGPTDADRQLYSQLGPDGAICGQSAPDEEFAPGDGPAPTSPDNPAGCRSYVDAPHRRDSTGGVGAKVRVFCAVPTTVSVTVDLYTDAACLPLVDFCLSSRRVASTTGDVTVKYPNKAAEFNDQSVTCKTGDPARYKAVISDTSYDGGAFQQDSHFSVPILPESSITTIDCST
jgi:hypothetical protein